MTGWNITFEIADANNDGPAEYGIELKNGTLREAIDIFGSRGYCAPNRSGMLTPKWLIRYDAENAHTGKTRDLFLNFPAHITPASRRRLARALSRPWR
jgi:hypothetical protein